MSLISPPPNQIPVQQEVNTKVSVVENWQEFFSSTFKLLNAMTLSGTTLQRPTKFLWVGRPYFDTSLGANGKPIFVNKLGTGWVLADGTAA